MVIIHLHYVCTYSFVVHCCFLAADQGRQMAMQMSMQQSPMAGKQQPSKMFEVCVSYQYNQSDIPYLCEITCRNFIMVITIFFCGKVFF